MADPTAIAASDLRKVYGTAVAVDGVSFTVRNGECFGFLGPNGAGKTSTVRMIQCVSPPSGGELQVLGMDVASSARAIKGRLGVVPQDNNLDPDLTVLENLLVYARYFDLSRGVARERARNLLEFVNLAERSHHRIGELSGGMRRRLVLARALVNEPDLLLLDEPTTGLDPQARHLVWSRLRTLQAQGVTMVLTTHYMEEAEQLCQRVAVMDRGAILVEGAPEELVRQRIGTQCVEVRPRPEARAELRRRLAAMSGRCEEVGDTLYFYPADGTALEALEDLPHQRLLHRPANLEDLFLRLTGRELRE